MRKLGSFLALVLLAASVWAFARYVAHRGEVRATILFKDAKGLGHGDAVVHGSETIGRVLEVSQVNGRDAVTVRINRDHRRDLLTDSLFAVEGHRIVVTNVAAVGAPVDDGAILEAREDGVSRFLAKHGGALEPMLDKLRKKTDEQLDALSADNFDAKLDEWKEKAPSWKKEGKASVDRRVAGIEARVDELVANLESSHRADEARRVKERFARWVDEIRK